MNNVTTARPSRTAIQIETHDGIVAVAYRVEDPMVLGLPARHRQYELVTVRGEYTARLKMTRPGLQLLLRKRARIVGRVS